MGKLEIPDYKKAEKARQIYSAVRDIPYSIPLVPDEYYHNDHSCLGKHDFLAKIFASIAIETRYRFCDFDWSGLNMPDYSRMHN